MSIPANSPVVAEGFPVQFRDQTVWRDPEDFENSYMIEIDFDGTEYDTFISGNKGVEVRQAYEMAAWEVLRIHLHDEAEGYGGLSNRAPLDVIQDLITYDPSLIRNALEHAQEYFTNPSDKSDIGSGLMARFANRNRITHDELTIRAITEMLVVRKKEKLIPQISGEWPSPMKGYEEDFVFEFEERRLRDWPHVHRAVVSSGHTDFIGTVYRTRGVPEPDVYMTDDEMRRQVQPRTKPDPFALELVERAWMNAYVVPHVERSDPGYKALMKGRQLYLGDDPDKDGGMAFNHGIDFGHYDSDAQTWKKIMERITRVVESGGVFNAAA